MSAFFMYIRQDRSYNSTENICEKKKQTRSVVFVHVKNRSSV